MTRPQQEPTRCNLEFESWDELFGRLALARIPAFLDIDFADLLSLVFAIVLSRPCQASKPARVAARQTTAPRLQHGAPRSFWSSAPVPARRRGNWQRGSG